MWKHQEVFLSLSILIILFSSEKDFVNNPISLYAATKMSNELIAHAYSHLYEIEMIGLRFFTVYGPWGRPDMAPMLFTNSIFNDRSINVFNSGNLHRDFTYIDDIVNGISLCLGEKKFNNNFRIYNIGNGKPVKLLDFINVLEKEIGITADKVMREMQLGDVYRTWADCSKIENDYNYKSTTSINSGVAEFIKWYIKYFKKKINV